MWIPLADTMKKLPTCVFLLLGLLVHYAHSQRPLSAANQTTPLQPAPAPSSRGTSTNRSSNRFNGTLPVGGGVVGGKGAGPGNKISNEDLSNKNKQRILKQNRLKPPPRNEQEGEVPIGLWPQSPFDVNAEGDYATPPHSFPGGSVSGGSFPSAPGYDDGTGIRGSSTGYSRPTSGKSSKKKFIELMGSGPPPKFPEGNMKNSSSVRPRGKNKFQELRNMTRQSSLGRYSKQEVPRIDLISYDPNEHINILPVKSNTALEPPSVDPGDAGSEETEDRYKFNQGFDDGYDHANETGGSFTEADPKPYHPKYLEHHDLEETDQLPQDVIKNNGSGNILKKIKSRFNMDNVRIKILL